MLTFIQFMATLTGHLSDIIYKSRSWLTLGSPETLGKEGLQLLSLVIERRFVLCRGAVIWSFWP